MYALLSSLSTTPRSPSAQTNGPLDDDDYEDEDDYDQNCI